MSEKVEGQEIENGQAGAPEELTEHELNGVAGGGGGGSGAHPLGPPPPAP
jgi:hypothetical protein